MNDDAQAPTPGIVPPKVSIVAGLVGLVLIVTVSTAAVFLVGGGLVWVASAVEAWLDFPPMSMLIAVLGVLLIATVLVAQGRIVTAIRDMRWGPFDVLRQHLEREEEDDEDDDDGKAPVARRGRRR